MSEYAVELNLSKDKRIGFDQAIGLGLLDELDQKLQHVTPEAVERALSETVPYAIKDKEDGDEPWCERVNFNLKLRTGRDFNWLAIAVRRALAVTVPDCRDDPKRKSNAEIRASFEEISGSLQRASNAISRLTEVERFWVTSLALSKGRRTVKRGEMVSVDDSECRHFQRALEEFQWFCDFFRGAVDMDTSKRDPHKWASAVRRRLRIEQGYNLARVFSAGYGIEPSSRDFRSSERYKGSPTPFADFYLRMIVLAFNDEKDRKATGFPEILKKAIRLHKNSPANLDEVIPDL